MDLKRIIYLHFPTYIKVKTKANVTIPDYLYSVYIHKTDSCCTGFGKELP